MLFMRRRTARETLPNLGRVRMELRTSFIAASRLESRTVAIQAIVVEAVEVFAVATGFHPPPTVETRTIKLRSPELAGMRLGFASVCLVQPPRQS